MFVLFSCFYPFSVDSLSASSRRFSPLTNPLRLKAPCALPADKRVFGCLRQAGLLNHPSPYYVVSLFFDPTLFTMRLIPFEDPPLCVFQRFSSSVPTAALISPPDHSLLKWTLELIKIPFASALANSLCHIQPGKPPGSSACLRPRAFVDFL